MEILKLQFENHVWQCRNQGAIICISKNENNGYFVSYEKNDNKLECHLIGEQVLELEKRLEELNIDTWKNEYHEPVLDGETWEMTVKFVDGREKSIQSFNGYPKNWKNFLCLYYWIAQCCKDAEPIDNLESIVINNSAYDIWELDKKFELLDQETISNMTGTGSRL